MKKKLSILVIILVLVFTANYFYSEFSLGLTSKLSSEMISVNENYYLGYSMQWRGLLNPKLVDVSLRNKDGSLIDDHNEAVEVVPFVGKEQHIGTVDESTFKEFSAKGLIDYVPIAQASISKNNFLVLRVNIKDEDYRNTVDTMILSYKIFGIPKQQVLKFDGFLQND